MSREIKRTSQFKKDVKLMLRQGRQLEPLPDVVKNRQGAFRTWKKMSF